MDFKKKLSLLYRSASRLLFVPVCVAGVMLGGIAATNQTQRSEEAEESIDCISYTLREYEGKIGIFYDGNTLPDKVLDVYLITLPADDVIRLRDGITASDQAEVRALIEDFSG